MLQTRYFNWPSNLDCEQGTMHLCLSVITEPPVPVSQTVGSGAAGALDLVTEQATPQLRYLLEGFGRSSSSSCKATISHGVHETLATMTHMFDSIALKGPVRTEWNISNSRNGMATARSD